MGPFKNTEFHKHWPILKAPSLSFDNYIQSCNHHLPRDTECPITLEPFQPLWSLPSPWPQPPVTCFLSLWFAFPRISYKGNQRVQSFAFAFHPILSYLRLVPGHRGSTAASFSMPCGFASCRCTTIWLSIHEWMDIWVSSFWWFEYSCCEHSCTSLYMDLFSFLRGKYLGVGLVGQRE